MTVVLSPQAQESCKVLKPEIADSYEGPCKKGLAHGEGKAEGKHTYVGRFKKGFPDGFGVYDWKNGFVYEGYWRKGMREGEGKYTTNKTDKDSVIVGIWKNDKYFGPIPVKPKIIEKMGVDRYSARRTGDGEQVIIDIYRSGVQNLDLENFRIQTSSGSQFNMGGSIAYENVEFPFRCMLRYKTWNKGKTARVDVAFEFEISQPGIWRIAIHN